jgi:putative phage-type endonuclease
MDSSIQGSQAWLQARCGVVTASRFNDVMSKIKSGEAATRYNYKAEIIAERLTGLPTESYTNGAMQWGVDHEDEARKVYEAINDDTVIQTGMIKHSSLEAGASPDGLVGSDGLIEIKCPNTATHIQTLLAGEMPKKHYAQVQGQMWITGRQWCDFISYDPRLDDKNAYFCVTIERDDEYIKLLEDNVTAFIEEVDGLLERLK